MWLCFTCFALLDDILSADASYKSHLRNRYVSIYSMGELWVQTTHMSNTGSQQTSRTTRRNRYVQLFSRIVLLQQLFNRANVHSCSEQAPIDGILESLQAIQLMHWTIRLNRLNFYRAKSAQWHCIGPTSTAAATKHRSAGSWRVYKRYNSCTGLYA